MKWLKALNWWYIPAFVMVVLSVGSGALYLMTRGSAPVAVMLLCMSIASYCFYKGGQQIPQIATVTAVAPVTGKVNCLCIYAVEDEFHIRKTVKIDFEYREETEIVAKLCDELPEDAPDADKAALNERFNKSVPAAVMNSDRWCFEDLGSKWMPVIYTDLDNGGAWRPFELPDAKYTDPARLTIQINRTAYQQWRELEATLFEKLKPLIMVGANIAVWFFMFLMASSKGG